MELRRFLTILTAGLVILIIIAVWFLPLNDDFRAENPSWNGASDLDTLYPALPLQSLSDLPLPPEGSSLIFIPYLNCTDAELAQLNSFVTAGGRLVLADDYGHGNQILEYLGLKARFSGQTLLDPVLNYKNQQFPKITQFAPGPLTLNTESLIFNHATCLVNIDASETIALSSSFSFLDLNDNGARDEGEPTGPLPAISRHGLGSGEVILISDPSLFINSMAIMEGNSRFIQNIAAVTTANLYIDQSHLPPSELHNAQNRLAQARGWLATPPATAGLVILALLVTLKPIWHKKKADAKEA